MCMCVVCACVCVYVCVYVFETWHKGTKSSSFVQLCCLCPHALPYIPQTVSATTLLPVEKTQTLTMVLYSVTQSLSLEPVSRACLQNLSPEPDPRIDHPQLS